MSRFALLAPLALLPSCVLPVPVPEGTPGAFEIVLDEGDPCGARRLQGLIGEPGFYVDDMRFESPVPVRVIRPGDAVTEDFSPQRLNVRLGADDRVVAVDCG